MPKNIIPYILGSKGSNINKIESFTGAKIEIRNDIVDDKGKKLVEISGPAGPCDKAAEFINMMAHPDEVWLPGESIDFIDERNHRSIHAIYAATGAWIETPNIRNNGKRLVYVMGLQNPVKKQKNYLEN